MDLAHYIKELDRNTGNILQILKEISEEQFEKKTGDAWSILEILDHLLVTDEEVFLLLLRPSEKISEKAELFGGDRLHKWLVELRTHKVSSPEFLRPKGLVKNESEFVEKFLRQRGKLVDALENGKIVIDNAVVKHPVIGEMTKTDWLNFIVSHAGRHILQIRDRLSES